MATFQHAYAVLMALVFLWAQVAVTSSTPSKSDNSHPSHTPSPKATRGDNTQQQEPPRAAEFRSDVGSERDSDDQRLNVVPTSAHVAAATLFPAYTYNQAGRGGSGGSGMSIAVLESADGVEMPPQVTEFVVDFYNKNSHELEMVGRVKRSGDQYLVARLAKSIGQNGGHGGSSYGGGSGYGGSGYGGSSYGGSGYGGSSYGGSGYGGSGYGGSGYGGSGHGGSGYGGSGYGGSGHGGQGGLGNLVSGGGHGKGVHLPSQLSYDHSYAKSPIISFVKGFKPGKIYVDKGHVVRNYFRHGTYNVALQHYKLIPTVKVVPYTTYKKIGVGEKVQAKYRYKAVICKYCYHGYPKIDVYEMKKPYNYAVRRFVYLPKEYDLNGHGSGRGQSYGNGGQDYGHGGQSYGHGGQSYGNGGQDYGHGGQSYGNGGQDYVHGGQSYGHGGQDYGHGGQGQSYDQYGGSGHGGSGSGGYGNGDYGNGAGYGRGKAKVTYHDYYPEGNGGYGNGGYGNGGNRNGGYGNGGYENWGYGSRNGGGNGGYH